MFGVRFNSYFNEAHFRNQTETKTRGRHTGESPEVISLLRNGLGRSDLPSLFNSKLIFMRLKNDGNAQKRSGKHEISQESLSVLTDVIINTLAEDDLTPEYRAGVHLAYLELNQSRRPAL